METNGKGRELGVFAWRVTAAHVVAYFIAGISAIFLMDYEKNFASQALTTIMRPIDSPIVALGAILQVIQGAALALILFPYRSVFLGRKAGWLLLSLLITGFTFFTPQVPGPGCFEGLLYMKLSLADHLIGLPEVTIYSLLFPFALGWWYRKPGKAWNVLAIVALFLIAAMSTLGYLSAVGTLKA